MKSCQWALPMRVAAFLFLCLNAILCFGQGNTANIVGTVTDSSGAVIQNASVILTNTQTGIVSDAKTNGSGEYRYQFLPPGTYTVTIKAPGFETFTREAFNLELNAELRIDATLRPGSATQVITVSSEAPLLQTETGTVSQTVDAAQLEELPIPGRDPQNIQMLVPGVVQDSMGQYVNGGGMEFHTAYYVDGTPNNQHTWAGNPITPNPDEVEEFTVLTSNLSAEYGNTGGMVLLTTIKSGTNQVHGTLFEFFQNDALDAGNYYNHTVTMNRFNRFGGSVGGPIRKDKTFFFLTSDIQRQHATQFFNNYTVPTSAFKNGDFSSLLGPQIGTDVLGRPIYKGEIYNPFTQRQVTDPATGQLVWVRDPFPGNKIPSQYLSAAALKLQALYPDPTGSGNVNNYSIAGPGGANNWQYQIKLDHNFSEKDRVSFRFSRSYQDDFNAQPYPNPYAGGGFPSLTQSGYQGTLNYVHTFSATVVNQAIVSWTQMLQSRGTAGFGDVGPSTFGINGFPLGTEALGTPTMQFAGGSSISELGSPGGALLEELEKDSSIYDNLTFVRGKHSIKVGGMYRGIATNSFQPNQQSGLFSFANTFTALPGEQANTGFDYADFLVGLPTNLNYSIAIDTTRVREPVFGAFIQDDFHVTDRLTVNLGFRWDNWFWPHEAKNQSGWFLPGAFQFQQFGKNGYRTSLYEQGPGIFQPRLGFAYRPFAAHSTVVRGGWGIIAMGKQGTGGNFLLPLNLLEASDNGNYLSQNGINWKTTLDNVPSYGPLVSVNSANYSSITIDPKTQPSPYIVQWNFDVQHQVRTVLLDIGYVGSNSVHLPFWSEMYGVNVNAIPLNLASTAQGRFTAPYIPYPQFPGGVNIPMSDGQNNYQALQAKAEQRMSNGLDFVASYTWSKTITLGQNPNTWGSSFRDPLGDWRLDRGPSTESYPRRFSAGFTYELPVGHGRKYLSSGSKLTDAVLGGWVVSGIVVAQSGHFLTPTLSYDSCKCGAANYPDLVGPLVLTHSTNVGGQWVSPSSFAAPAQWSSGNSGEGTLLGPGYFNIDATLGKKFAITERWQVELRGEAYNLTNHPSFGDPNMYFPSATFGQISSTAPNYSPRYLQLALKVYF